jgi:hypothetical protein
MGIELRTRSCKKLPFTYGDMTSSPSTRPMSACTAAPASLISQCELDMSRCNPRARAARSTPRINSEKNSP